MSKVAKVSLWFLYKHYNMVLLCNWDLLKKEYFLSKQHYSPLLGLQTWELLHVYLYKTHHNDAVERFGFLLHHFQFFTFKVTKEKNRHV